MNQNIRDGYLIRPPGTKRGNDRHPINLKDTGARCREALEHHRQGRSLQMGMMI